MQGERITMTKRITNLDIAKAAHALNHLMKNVGYYKDGSVYHVVIINTNGSMTTLNLFVNKRDLYDYLVRKTDDYKLIHGVA
jgi:hypothetical protein